LAIWSATAWGRVPFLMTHKIILYGYEKLLIHDTYPTYSLIDLYRERSSYPPNRGLAADCAVISVFLLSGQVINSLVVAQVIQWYGNSMIINPYGACAAFVGLLLRYQNIFFGEKYGFVTIKLCDTF